MGGRKHVQMDVPSQATAPKKAAYGHQNNDPDAGVRTAITPWARHKAPAKAKTVSTRPNLWKNTEVSNTPSGAKVPPASEQELWGVLSSVSYVPDIRAYLHERQPSLQ